MSFIESRLTFERLKKYFDLNDMKIIRKEIFSLYVIEILKIPKLQLVVCHREQIVLKL